jgi:hypothetical protein
MANEEPEIRISKIFVRAECENCSFKRNNIEIEGRRFNNNAGYITIIHLAKHNDHIIRLIVGNLVYRYRLDNNIFHQIENEVKGE